MSNYGTAGYGGASAPVMAAVPIPQAQQPPLSIWSTGLCQCLDDVASCCDGMWCGPCQTGFQYNMVTKGIRDMDVMACVLTWLIGVPCGAMYMRSQVRRVFNIEGTGVEDVCTGLCCSHCVLCQNYRELSIRGFWCGGVCVSAPYMQNAAPVPATMVGGSTRASKQTY